MITTPEQMREAVACAMWKAEAERATPNVARMRTSEAFGAENENMRQKWLSLADAAVLAIPIAPQPSENRLFNPDSHWGDFIRSAVAEAEKAMRKYPQPNYVITKVAEEAGEVVKAAVHAAEGRETLDNVRGEMLQLVAMLFRLWMEGDQVHGLLPVSGVIAASANTISPQPVAVTVKPLVWKASGFEGNHKSGSLGLGYFVECAARQFSCSVSDGRGSLFKVLYRGASEEAAKAAAQRHHDALLRAELTIQPADPLSDPRVVALVEALRHAQQNMPHPDQMIDDAIRAIGGEA